MGVNVIHIYTQVMYIMNFSNTKSLQSLWLEGHFLSGFTLTCQYLISKFTPQPCSEISGNVIFHEANEQQAAMVIFNLYQSGWLLSQNSHEILSFCVLWNDPAMHYWKLTSSTTGDSNNTQHVTKGGASTADFEASHRIYSIAQDFWRSIEKPVYRSGSTSDSSDPVSSDSSMTEDQFRAACKFDVKRKKSRAVVKAV